MSVQFVSLYVCNLWYHMFRCNSTYHKSTDAPLWRFPFEAAVNVAACVDQEHDAAPNSVEVAQQQLNGRQRQNKLASKTREHLRSERCCREVQNMV